MKRLFISLVIIALAVMMVNMTSCKKEKTNENLNSHKDVKNEEILENIIQFKNQVEFYNTNPRTKIANSVSVEKAVWNLEALFNYTYAYPELYYDKTVVFDTIMYLPINANDSILISDLVAFYNQMFKTVIYAYQSITLPNKQFIILDVEEGVRSNDRIEIKLNTVQGSVNNAYSSRRDIFRPWEWWYYGEDMGGWDSDEGDAAQILTLWLNLALTPEPPEIGYYVYSMITERTSLQPSDYSYINTSYQVPDQYCEFEVVGNPYVADSCLILKSEQLNFHYYGELDLIQNRLYHENIHDSRTPFYALVTSGCDRTINRNYIRVFHNTRAWYGIKILCVLGGHERGILEP